MNATKTRSTESPDSTPIGNWEQDLTTGELRWSEGVFEILGIAPETPPSQEVFETHLHPDDRKRVLSAAMPKGGKERSVGIQFRIVRRDRSIRHLQAFFEFLRDANGIPIQSKGVIVDLTESKQEDEGQGEAIARAAAVHHTKTGILATMSHELRTPLTSILGFSEILRRERFGPLGNAKYREYIDDIHKAGTYLLSVFNRILDTSRIEAGAIDLVEEKLGVAATIAACEELVINQANEAGLDLTTAVADDLPALFADPYCLNQVLLNLLDNAIKYTPAGGQIDVAVHVDELGAMVFAISDTGIGIAAADIEKALQPFMRVGRNPDLAREGSGLGLSLAKSMTELHGGTIELTSELNTGTTVKLRFPADRVVVAASD